MHSFDEPVYMISDVSKALGIRPQTLRQYEKEGFITPARSEGKIRLYSQRNIDEIKDILKLTRDLGVNIAGVDMVLKMRTRIKKLEIEIEDLREKLCSLNQDGLVPPSKQIVPVKSHSIVLVEENQ
jgi:MerR family transcriptional regulator/heat shock protein HspR